jgi:hypothetical protein
MDTRDPLSARPSFARELEKLPVDVAAEFADHLAEETDRLVQTGLAPDAARTRALAQFGDLGAIADSAAAANRHAWWLHTQCPWELKLVVAGWMLSGIYVFQCICADADPSYTSIGLCLIFGTAFALAGSVLLRRLEFWRRAALGFSLVVSLLMLAKLAASNLLPDWERWSSLSPTFLAVMAVLAVLFGGLLTRRSVRSYFLARPI